MHVARVVSLRDVRAVNSYLPFIVIGLVTGSVYGIASLGLVLTYKTSGVFNFGHGAIAAAAAVVFFELHERQHMAWPLAALISVLAFGVVAGAILERVAAGLSDAPTAYRIIATVALILIVPAIYGLTFGAINYNITTFLPSSAAFTISEVKVGWDAVTTALLGVAAVVGLYAFFRNCSISPDTRRPAFAGSRGSSGPASLRHRACCSSIPSSRSTSACSPCWSYRRSAPPSWVPSEAFPWPTSGV
jgi:ABC-type branched-subunit amino acid transport system permease subunit